MNTKPVTIAQVVLSAMKKRWRVRSEVAELGVLVRDKDIFRRRAFVHEACCREIP